MRREESRVTVTLVVMSSVSKWATAPAPDGITPLCQFVAVLQFPEASEIQNPGPTGGPPSGTSAPADDRESEMLNETKGVEGFCAVGATALLEFALIQAREDEGRGESSIRHELGG